MNYTNKDFYARISRIEDLNFSVRREVELHLAEDRTTTKDSSRIAFDDSKARSTTGCSRASVAPRVASMTRNNGGSTVNVLKANNSTHSSENSCVVIAITEGRGHAEGEIGLAAMDVNSPSLILSQISDAFWYRDTLLKLQILNPSEIIIPLTVFQSGSKLLDEIKSVQRNITITPIPRRYFSDRDILNTLSTLCTDGCKTTLKILEKKYYAVSAVAGLLAYAKNVMMLNFAPNSLRVEFQNKLSRMFIDFDCLHRLELLYSLVETREKRCCLYGLLNNTLTAIGARCLRAYILEPFCDLKEIQDRQECIKELLSNPNYLLVTQECLKKFSCCDQLLKLCIVPPEDEKIKSIELMINRVLLLKSTLESVVELRNVLKHFKSDIFKKMLNALEDTRFQIMLDKIKEVIQPEISSVKSTAQCFQRIYAIKSGVCEYLDFMRGIYSSLVEQMRGVVNDLVTKYGLPLRMIYTVPKGFHMQLTSTSKNPIRNIPSGLDVMCQKGGSYYLTNSDLYKLNVRMTDVIEELHLASYRAARNLIENLSCHADASYGLIGVVSTLDIVLSLAKVSSKDGYNCPRFESETRIVDAVHPFLEYTAARPVPVPNNIIGTPDYNFYIITGPNMGGKTLYIKMIGVLQIMAQLGCFVPAQDASFRICDRIFARIGFEDRVEKDSSSYVKEIREFQYILANMTSNSLLIVDEICRNTNPEEGKQIAFKICHALATMRVTSGSHSNRLKCEEKKDDRKKPDLISSTSPFIYLTTHFLELTKLSGDHLNVSNLFLHAEQNVREEKLHLVYTHKVMEGVTPIRGYGLALARTVRFPRNILQRAEEIYEALLSSEKNHLQSQTRASKKDARNSYLDSIEASIKHHSQSMQHSQRSSKTVSSFLNKCKKVPSQQRSSSNVNESKLVDLNSDLYDIYAQILSTIRKNSTNPSDECEHFIQDFIEKQPKELLDAIYQLDRNSFGGIVSMPRNTLATECSTQLTTATNDQDKTNLLELSYHSLLRRLHCDPKELTGNQSVDRLSVPSQDPIWQYTPAQSNNLSYRSTHPGSLPNNTVPGTMHTCPANLNQTSRSRLLNNTGYHTFAGVSRTFSVNGDEDDERGVPPNFDSFHNIMEQDVEDMSKGGFSLSLWDRK